MNIRELQQNKKVFNIFPRCAATAGCTHFTWWVNEVFLVNFDQLVLTTLLLYISSKHAVAGMREISIWWQKWPRVVRSGMKSQFLWVKINFENLICILMNEFKICFLLNSLKFALNAFSHLIIIHKKIYCLLTKILLKLCLE